MAYLKLKPKYNVVNGIRYPRAFKEEWIKEVMDYKPTAGDFFIVTYPKCGTIWMQMVTLHIFRKGQELENYADFKMMCPFIEKTGKEGIVNMPRPGAFKTHLPYNLMPYSPDAKYIFVLRNPKDTCVSLFYHSQPDYSEGDFDEFFEHFMAGEVEYNDYFDHLQSWYPHRKDKMVFHTTYEDMKEDMKSVVLQLATFLGQEYMDAIEKDNNILNNILCYSEFNYMKKHLTEHFKQPHKKNREINEHPEENCQSKMPGVKKSHFRKGIVGDWKNHFSEEQSERLNRKFFKRFGGAEIYEKYKPFL